MKRTVTKIIIVLIVVAALVGVGVTVYIRNNNGPIIGSVKLGTRYHLESIRPNTDRFAGATMSSDSYFYLNTDAKSGKFYLKDLTATNESIPFIVTNYKESNKQTEFNIAYLINNGADTKIQYLRAISKNDKIYFKAVESHTVKIIHQKHDDINSDDGKEILDYEVDILVFSLTKEAA